MCEHVNACLHSCSFVGVCQLYIPSILKLQEGYQKNGNQALHQLLWFLIWRRNIRV